ncbi:hypothetical protein M5K25_024751 [Dendrobium thyrsiflorum]|uniref:Retrotransposon Copia-like N-terminal domain-containing protein n=1 Tax=Dendrobium thyrsiflorum TaxID=117978 RepID=A0ABD0U314_DENTH
MVKISTSNTADTPAANSNPMIETIIPSSFKFLMENIKSIAHIDLTSENYSIWRLQILKLFSANHFAGYLMGDHRCPPKLLTSATGAVEPNPAYPT